MRESTWRRSGPRWRSGESLDTLAALPFVNAIAVVSFAIAVQAPRVQPPAVEATPRAAQTVLVGVVEVLIEDAQRGSRILYFLAAGNRRVPLRFVRPPLNLTTGTRVRVRGRWEKGGTLAVTSLERI